MRHQIVTFAPRLRLHGPW